MNDCQFKSGQYDPYDVHDDSDGASWGFGLTNLPAEWRHAQDRKFETLDSERNANDGEAQKNSAQYVGEGYQETTEDKPKDIKHN